MNNRTAFQKKYLLLLLCYMIGAATLSVIAPILPYQMKEKNIPESSTGIIFCIFSVAGFVGSQICGKYMAVYGAKIFIYGGLILFCLSHYQFSLLNYVHNPYLFIGMAIVARIFEGFSFGVIGSTTYGVSSQELPPQEFDKYARANSTVYGVGEGLSLILGSLMFMLGGYMMPYFILGSIFLLFAAILYISGALVEQDINIISNRDNIELISSSEKKEHKMTHKFAFSIPTVKYGCLSIIISNICQTYLDPIMAMKLYQFGIMADKSGYIFIFFVLSYSLFGFLGGYISQYISERALICLGYILGYFQLFFTSC